MDTFWIRTPSGECVTLKADKAQRLSDGRLGIADDQGGFVAVFNMWVYWRRLSQREAELANSVIEVKG